MIKETKDGMGWLESWSREKKKKIEHGTLARIKCNRS